MKNIKNLWMLLGKYAKQFEILLLVLTVVLSFSAFQSTQRSLSVSQQQFDATKKLSDFQYTAQKLIILNDHYNEYLVKNPLFQDVQDGKLVGHTQEAILQYLDEFEYIKMLRDKLGIGDVTIYEFYGKTIKKTCKIPEILNFAKQNSKTGFM